MTETQKEIKAKERQLHGVSVKRLVMPGYQSDEYYNAVIKGIPFMGWTAPDVGLGRMRFVHPEHGEFRVTKGVSKNWMEECWNDFINFISRLEA